MKTLKDCIECVALQREIWGFDRDEIVPASLLHVVDYVGGIAAGAFDNQGTMLGFVFGITGVHRGELAHWSHMLGVRESARDHGVGRMLKAHQRHTLAALNVTRMFWTFDPLMAKNAYFNLNRLGAEVLEYVPNMYGATASPLHLGLPTDRLVVYLTTDEQSSPVLKLPAENGVPILTPYPHAGDHTAADDDARIVFVEMPSDIQAVLSQTPDQAARWRVSLRDNFQWALAHGLTARGVHRSSAAGRSFYVMARD